MKSDLRVSEFEAFTEKDIERFRNLYPILWEEEKKKIEPLINLKINRFKIRRNLKKLAEQLNKEKLVRAEIKDNKIYLKLLNSYVDIEEDVYIDLKDLSIHVGNRKNYYAVDKGFHMSEEILWYVAAGLLTAAYQKEGIPSKIREETDPLKNKPLGIALAILSGLEENITLTIYYYQTPNSPLQTIKFDTKKIDLSFEEKVDMISGWIVSSSVKLLAFMENAPEEKLKEYNVTKDIIKEYVKNKLTAVGLWREDKLNPGSLLRHHNRKVLGW